MDIVATRNKARWIAVDLAGPRKSTIRARTTGNGTASAILSRAVSLSFVVAGGGIRAFSRKRFVDVWMGGPRPEKKVSRLYD